MPNQAQLYQQISHGQHRQGLKLIEHLNPQAGQRILDIGAGTGNLTYELAKQVGPTGAVFALDPDAERLAVAKEKQPADIKNITWFHGDLTAFAEQYNDAPFDGAYSNYVFHWIPEQLQAIKQVRQVLKADAVFAFCCVFGMPEMIQAMCRAVPDGEQIIDSIQFVAKEQLVDYFKQADFTVLEQFEVPDYDFDNVVDVMSWWEATTHGRFALDKLSEAEIEQFKTSYPGSIHIYQDETLCLLAKAT